MEDQTKLVERVAKLEARVEAQADQLETANEKLDELLTKFTRYEGWWGGVFAVCTALWVFFRFLWGDIKKFFTGTD